MKERLGANLTFNTKSWLFLLTRPLGVVIVKHLLPNMRKLLMSWPTARLNWLKLIVLRTVTFAVNMKSEVIYFQIYALRLIISWLKGTPPSSFSSPRSPKSTTVPETTRVLLNGSNRRPAPPITHWLLRKKLKHSPKIGLILSTSWVILMPILMVQMANFNLIFDSHV